jgi:FkbM family methyltransferase
MKIYEIGVGEPNVCRTCGYKNEDYRNTDNECFLYEPNPETFKRNKDVLSGHSNFHIKNCAVGDKNGKITLCLAGDSSFVSGTHSPEINHRNDYENYCRKVEVDMVDIRDIDNGDIDILLLDTEGCEYDIIKNLKSRPKKIVVEMQSIGVGYRNPHFDEIVNWMKENGYVHESSDALNEDFTYIKK